MTQSYPILPLLLYLSGWTDKICRSNEWDLQWGEQTKIVLGDCTDWLAEGAATGRTLFRQNHSLLYNKQ